MEKKEDKIIISVVFNSQLSNFQLFFENLNSSRRSREQIEQIELIVRVFRNTTGL